MRTARGGDLYGITRLLVQEGAADRRRRGDESLGSVGVLGHHERKHHLLAVAVDHVERRSEAGAISRNPIDVEQRDLGDALLEHADAGFDEALPLFRRMVFRVLPKVAQLAGALDLFRELELQLMIERLDLLLEFFD